MKSNFYKRLRLRARKARYIQIIEREKSTIRILFVSPVINRQGVSAFRGRKRSKAPRIYEREKNQQKRLPPFLKRLI